MGLLIVNADDLGRDSETTDAILRCFEAQRITSASAMVWMSDSKRAAALAREYGLPVRLHLNLTEVFSDASAPRDVQERQASLARHFSRSRFAYWICNPMLQSTIEASIEDQIQGFEQLYGHRPTGLDGHQHVHTCLNVLLARSLRPIEAVRSTFTFSPTEKGPANRTTRAMMNRLLRRRFRSTHWFGSLRAVNSSLDSTRLEEWIARARVSTVELMTHPGVPDELDYLMSKSWKDAIAPAPLGTFRDLPRKRPRSRASESRSV